MNCWDVPKGGLFHYLIFNCILYKSYKDYFYVLGGMTVLVWGDMRGKWVWFCEKMEMILGECGDYFRSGL